ncbi:hypothetical protein FVER14953_09795 [Fusarium verticillioides]|nr:hypothetical protein FVER14953_09795 [Fusarium verticillioides]
MLYEYPARWFKNTVSGGTKSNTRLPERDKKWIANTYLPWSSDIGQFSTLQVRPFDTFSSDPVQQDMAFEPSYIEPPQVAVG